MMLKFITLFVISSLIRESETIKVLIVFPLAVRSHGILGDGYVEHLLRAGHEVTYITPFPRQDPPANLTEVIVSYPDEMLPSNSLFTVDNILKGKNDITLSEILNMVYDSLKYFIKHENVLRLINDQEVTFDVAVIEWLFTELNAGFAPLFRCPLIWSSSLDPHWLILRLVDESPNPAYVPDILSNNVHPLTFLQRARELWTQISSLIVMKFVDFKYNALYNEIFVPAGIQKGITMPPYEELKYNASFVLSSSHVSLGEPVRLPQNFIPLGGHYIDLNPKPLPENLKRVMDNSENGFIYFSMGSNLKSKDLPEVMKKGLLKIFSELKQTVIWKFEETLSDIPNNVHIVKWTPQQSILAHPNCVLFITHGGLLSTTETVHFGVPIIGIPVFGDQFINVDRAVNRGFAKKVDLSFDTPKHLKIAIQDVLNNPRYRERAKYLSLIYHDRPVPPSKELVHWVEHTVKTRGAPHLRSRALMTPWYQKMYLDLIGLVVIVVLICCNMIKKMYNILQQPIDKYKKIE